MMSTIRPTTSRVGLGALGVAAAAVTLLSGCGGVDDRPVRWSYIHAAIIEPTCATVSCHARSSPPARVRLDARAEGYRALLPDNASDQVFFVVPGDPQRSKLVSLLRADEARRMPRDAPLPEADIALIERWILAGAEDN